MYEIVRPEYLRAKAKGKNQSTSFMSSMSLRTKFLGGFAALLCMITALAFTSLRAMSSLNDGLERVVHRMSVRADKTSTASDENF